MGRAHLRGVALVRAPRAARGEPAQRVRITSLSFCVSEDPPDFPVDCTLASPCRPLEVPPCQLGARISRDPLQYDANKGLRLLSDHCDSKIGVKGPRP